MSGAGEISTMRGTLGPKRLRGRFRTAVRSVLSAFRRSPSKGSAAPPTRDDDLESRLESLETEILTERTRVDRCGGHFTAVTFQSPPEQTAELRRSATDSARAILLPVLTRRVRATDSIGKLPPDGLGVVLPHTMAEGAAVFAQAIVAKAQAFGLNLSYQTYQYPPDLATGSPSDAAADPSQTSANSAAHAHPGLLDKRLGSAAGAPDPASIMDLLPPLRIPAWKRAIDIVGAVLGILCSAPLFLVLATFVKTVSPGPILIRQDRIGLGGRPFRMWKLRTMHPNADSRVHKQHVLAMIAEHGDTERPMQKLDATDPRIIPGGHWLRRTSIDELPQLLNVLAGEMSLVGPRPEMPYAFVAYEPWQVRRFDVLPGMTGLWQVSGKNRTTFREMIRLDIHYGRRLLPWRDIAIIAKTLPVLLDGDNGISPPGAARPGSGDDVQSEWGSAQDDGPTESDIASRS
jgi:lipopolysaccharide/colanic/teichoic acid biosynthesis glycosyltransferase